MGQTRDVIIIGAGSAGLAALREVRKRTDNFLLINDGPYGTTCARVGCMPSKALIEAANAFHQRHRFDAFAIRGADQLTVEVPAVLNGSAVCATALCAASSRPRRTWARAIWPGARD
jgi:dihydrolipoamide dehydrogenase